jgi:hypothetical protein
MEKSRTLHVEETETLKKEISSVKESLAIQQAATEAERRHVASLEFKLKQSELIRNQMEQAPLMVNFFAKFITLFLVDFHKYLAFCIKHELKYKKCA